MESCLYLTCPSCKSIIAPIRLQQSWGQNLIEENSNSHQQWIVHEDLADQFMPRPTVSGHYTANMSGSHAESQQHIHSINKCNDLNLACVDYLPMIVWLAKLYVSHKPDMFCSAALIGSSLCLTASTWCCWMEWVSIVRLTWIFFYPTCQVHNWKSNQFINVISQTLIPIW